jgi:hypothetical protein
VIREAVAAAEYTLDRLERRIDLTVGVTLRKMLGRYCSVLIAGVPIAYAVPGFRWSSESTYGLLAGMLLLAAIDALSAAMRGGTRPPI